MCVDQVLHGHCKADRLQSQASGGRLFLTNVAHCCTEEQTLTYLSAGRIIISLIVVYISIFLFVVCVCVVAMDSLKKLHCVTFQCSIIDLIPYYGSIMRLFTASAYPVLLMGFVRLLNLRFNPFIQLPRERSVK